MALDNFRTIELIWDKANKSIIKTIKTSSSDKTGRYFSVKILDGGQEVTLNNAKLQLYWEHPNFNTSGTDDFETMNNGGLFKMTFSDEMLTNIGELNAHLILNLPDGKITSDGFPIEVFKGADDGVVVPTNSNGLVKQIDGKIDKGNVTMGDLTQEVKLALTGGAVAVVGENAVGTENIKDGTISMSKLDNQLKDMVDSRFTNKITNGDFSNGLVGWRVANGSNAELTTDGHVKISGAGGSTLPRIIQGVTDGNVNGHKIYISGSFMSENSSMDSLGFNIYRDNNVSYDIQVNKIEPNVWLQIGDIIEPDSGSGSLRVQPVAQYPSIVDAKDNSFLVDNIIVIDLTEAFGYGNEPTYKEVQNFLNDGYFEGTMLASEIVKKEIELFNKDVGENAVGTENIKDGSISMPKLDNQLKDILDSRFTNEITNGNFSNGLEGWKVATGSSAELTAGGHVRISGNGESTLPRLLQGATDGYVNGHKIYVSGSFMSENLSTDNLGFNIYRDNNVSYDIRLNHPEPNVWLQIGDIIEPDVGTGTLGIQPVAKYPSASAAKDNSFLVDNIMVMDLTEIFGPGKEPTYKEVQNFLDGAYFEGTLSVSELVKKEITLSNAKDTNVNAINKSNTLPFSRDKFTSEELVLLDYNSLNLIDKVGVFTRRTNTDTPTVVLNSTGDTSRLSSVLGQRIDLSGFDYIELHLNVKDQTQFSNLRVVLSTSASDHFANDNLTHRLNEVKEDGYRVLRVPMSTFFGAGGNPSLTSIETIRLVFSGGSVESPSSIEVVKVSAVKGRKGAVYMQFDDGTIGQYKYAFPILEKYGLRGTIAVPTERVGKTVGLSGERPTWSQLREMQDAGWLVVSHGLDERSLNSMSDEELDRQLRVSSQMLFDRGFTFGSKCIVAPQSAWDDRVERFARKYFAIARNRSYGNGPRRDVYPQNHHRYQKCMGPHGAPIEELKSWIDEAIQYKQEVTMSWHMVQPEEPAKNKTYWDTPERLEAVCAYIREKIDEGVLECVTWQDTMLQSMHTQSVDAKGNEYLVSKDSDLTLLKLPIYTD